MTYPIKQTSGNESNTGEDRWSGPQHPVSTMMISNNGQTVGGQRALREELSQLVDVVGPAPLVDLLLERAFEVGATDVHIDPVPDGVSIRLRIDGFLHSVLDLNNVLAPQVISRVKLMAGMNITERRYAQDGHISNAVLRSQRDIRVGSGPTIHGERLVLRLMPDTRTFSRLEEIGFDEPQLELVEHALRIRHGMILCVGPVGCGKSTTTYAILNRVNEPGKSVTTIEDPVERRIAGTVQVQIDPKIRFGFVEALRGVLRQDPDVIMVGEIRDPETAQIGARAALTGIQVLSTLHAHDTAAAIDVFRQFGVPPMFIADSINCIIAQRLLRMVCTRHRETFRPDAATLEMLGFNPDDPPDVELVRGLPHEDNLGTGYSGRTGVFEVLSVTEPLRGAILHHQSSKEIQRLSRQTGTQSLEDAAIKKVLAGVTTIEEMHRVLL
jgi:type II secretory ATPase GspE/PulE/Tfp pilus assembly ATPase PilB-like protein